MPLLASPTARKHVVTTCSVPRAALFLASPPVAVPLACYAVVLRTTFAGLAHILRSFRARRRGAAGAGWCRIGRGADGSRDDRRRSGGRTNESGALKGARGLGSAG